jgi:hypothetical protein
MYICHIYIHINILYIYICINFIDDPRRYQGVSVTLDISILVSLHILRELNDSYIILRIFDDESSTKKKR